MKFIKTRIEAITAKIDRGIGKIWRATGIPNAIEKKANSLRRDGHLGAAACWSCVLPLLGSVLATLFNINRFIFGSSGWLEHLIPVLIMVLAWLKTGEKLSDAHRRFKTLAQEDAEERDMEP